jgi:hypothetical protein
LAICERICTRSARARFVRGIHQSRVAVPRTVHVQKAGRHQHGSTDALRVEQLLHWLTPFAICERDIRAAPQNGEV